LIAWDFGGSVFVIPYWMSWSWLYVFISSLFITREYLEWLLFDCSLHSLCNLEGCKDVETYLTLEGSRIVIYLGSLYN